MGLLKNPKLSVTKIFTFEISWSEIKHFLNQSDVYLKDGKITITFCEGKYSSHFIDLDLDPRDQLIVLGEIAKFVIEQEAKEKTLSVT